MANFIKSIVLGLDIDELKKNAEIAENKIEDLGDACKGTSNSVDELSESTDGYNKSITPVIDITDGFKFAVDGASQAIAAMIEAIQDCINTGTEYADTIEGVTSQTGWSNDIAQQWQNVASQTDTSVDDISKAFENLEKQMKNASVGSAKSKKAFEDLGVSFQYSNGKMKDGDTVFKNVVDKLSDMEDQTKATQLGMQLFGGSYNNMANIIKGGTEGIDQAAEAMHGFLSDEELQALNDFGDVMSKVSLGMDRLKSHLGADFAEKLTPIMEKLADFLDESDKLADSIWKVVDIFKELGKIVTNFETPATKLYNWISSFCKMVERLYDTLLQMPDAIDGLGSFSDFTDGIKMAFTGHNASGTENWRGGLTWVGEEGPELVSLPTGSRIYNNTESSNMSSNVYNITMNCDLSSMRSLSDVVDAVNGLNNSRRSFV